VTKLISLFVAKVLSLGKTHISSWLNFSRGKTYNFFLAKLFFLGKFSIYSWLNFSFGKTYISFSLIFSLLEKPIFIFG
jgi:hypothetical protein